LVVDPDAVLPGSSACQSLQSIAWRDPQLLKIVRGVQDEQLSLCPTPDLRWQSGSSLAPEDPLGISVGATLDHTLA